MLILDIRPKYQVSSRIVRQVDCYGLCACIHQLLFFSEMLVMKENWDDIDKRGFYSLTPHQSLHDHVWLPKVTLKRYEIVCISQTNILSYFLFRYWSKSCWSKLYIIVLNKCDLENLRSVLLELESLVKSVGDSRLKVCQQLYYIKTIFIKLS